MQFIYAIPAFDLYQPVSFSTHPLAHLIHEMDQTSTVIKIVNLTLEHSTALVAEALEMDEEVEEIQHLGVIIQKKTRGNPFFM